MILAGWRVLFIFQEQGVSEQALSILFDTSKGRFKRKCKDVDRSMIFPVRFR